MYSDELLDSLLQRFSLVTTNSVDNNNWVKIVVEVRKTNVEIEDEVVDDDNRINGEKGGFVDISNSAHYSLYHQHILIKVYFYSRISLDLN